MKLPYDLWRYADMAYRNPDGSEKLFRESKFFPMKIKLGFGFIAVEEKRIVISFMGTEKNIPDWIRNFTGLTTGDGLIHQGFYDEWSEFKSKVSSIVGNNLTKDVYVTGHSQGGAIGIICGRHITKNLKKPCSCVVYGAPKQGRRKYRDEINKLPMDVTTFVNGFDIVPNLKLQKILGFKHAGKVVKLKQPLFHRLICKIFDHLQKNYEKALKKKYK